MVKTLLTLLVASAALFATDGYEIYKKNCMSCHVEIMKKSDALANLQTLKAPPMVEVSGRIKENIIIKDDDDDVHRHIFILFVKDYIENPQIEYSMCNPGAIEKFGTMPKLKNKLSAQEKEAVAEWLYDRYEDVVFE